MNDLQFRLLMEEVAAKWPDAPEWPDETLRLLLDEMRPFTHVSAAKAVGSLFRSDRARGFRPSPSQIISAVRDFGEADPEWTSRALPGGCEHLDVHEAALLVVPTGRPFVPDAIPEAERDRFAEEMSRPSLLGGRLLCLRCRRIDTCHCPECVQTRFKLAEARKEAS